MALQQQQAFLNKYHFTQEEFATIGMPWEELEAIHDEFVRGREDYQHAARSIVERLSAHPAVHSLKYRLKDPEHLIAKIIRKRLNDPGRAITLETYEKEITDLIGVRVLHLFKPQWSEIHELLTNTWDALDDQAPCANVREGDDVTIFESAGCEVKQHPRGYRSVHYVITCRPTRRVHIAEIQVRTLFEEGWSETDHLVAYPRDFTNPILGQYLGIFNVLAGAADLMATSIIQLRDELSSQLSKHIATKDELAATINRLETLESQLNLEREEKETLERIVRDLKKSQTQLSSPAITTTPGSFYPLNLHSNAAEGLQVFIGGAVCSTCGISLGTSAAIGNQVCSRCAASLPWSTGPIR